MQHALSQKLLLIPFLFILCITLWFAFMHITTVWGGVSEGSAYFKDYPFGFEAGGYSYGSERTYFAVSVIWSFVFLQAIIVSVLSFLSQHFVLAFLLLALPVFLDVYMALMF